MNIKKLKQYFCYTQKQSKFIFLIFVMIIGLFSCSDRSNKFSNGITYINEGVNYNFVTKKGTKGFYLEPNVLEVEEHENWILFVQEIDMNRLYEKLKEELSSESYDEDNLNRTLDSVVKDSIRLFTQTRYNKTYWILNKKNDSLLGPFENKKEVKEYAF